jgi:adenylate cyclase class 2
MQYEVEQKFAVDDSSAVEFRLRELGAAFHDPIEQSDRYYNHPARDFGQTDEALRIRCIGDNTRVTYKGPKIDTQTKTRREIELPIGEPGEGRQSAEQLSAMLELLGFRFVAEVRKTRRTAELLWQGQHVEVALDDVADVGRFVELETSAADAALQQAKQRIIALAADLGLAQHERRSYLEMLLKRRSG